MSFSKSARKVVKGITPVKIKGERRTSNEIDTTVVNTLHSAWTPKKGGVLNSQLFEERKILIGHWFENWTDTQRRQFLEHLVEKFNKMSIHFVHNMIKDRVPQEPKDFTRALPQHISLKILGYLDPRTLAQASLVSWHWKWLCEHDVVWKPKCLRRGWDYGKPIPSYERAVWKRFYQQQVWDLLHPPPPPPPLDITEELDLIVDELELIVEEVVEEDGMLNNSAESGGRRSSAGGGARKKSLKGQGHGKPKAYKLGETAPMNLGYMKHREQELPPWRSSDNKPKDIQLYNKEILGINSETVPRHISEKFQKIEIHRSPQSPRCNRSLDVTGRSKSRENIKSPMQSKSLVMERNKTVSPSALVKSNSSGNVLTTSTPARTNTKKKQGPMQRKLNGVSTKTMTNAAKRGATNPRNKNLKKNGSDSVDDGEDITLPAAWGQKPDLHAAKRIASTDTLGSDAALDQESNDSLYGDDSGKLLGEAWEMHSNISDQ
ncbi:uncharacterized protein LOC134823447 isoform X2 [Bolinopsis microptera]|uniref:uncharacterized protein LOC134823447 isoform X2 n=1 Tax=Bolinopsis microptera TaxID=2820187 RepID=UPI003079EF76